MDELYLQTEQGNVPIDKNMKRKYNLKKGTKSPFTDKMIVDAAGNAEPEQKEPARLADESGDGQILSVAEQIDFAQGADSN